jgi:dUTP pyrophosphatase
MLIEYYRMRADVQPPERANPSDAGLDLFFNPDPKGFLISSENDGVLIECGRSVLLPTGYKFGIPHGYMLEIKNRSGMAAKRGLVVGACVVDSGYDGEVFVNLHNIGDQGQIITPQTKIAQAVLIPVVHFRAIETQNPNLYSWYPITISDRGDGSLGSTGE